MKQRPIIFSGDMVQAILQGRKTQTRDIVKPQPPAPECSYSELIDTCPYGKVGDVLYVKEDYRVTGAAPEDGHFIITYADGAKQCVDGLEDEEISAKWLEQVSDDACEAGRDTDEKDDFVGCQVEDFRSRPSIDMPQFAARIFLRITDIRVERLQDISEEDAKAEGIKSFRPVPGDGPAHTMYYHYVKDNWGPSAIHSFQTLWESINGAASWMSSPFVWVLSFERIEKPEIAW